MVRFWPATLKGEALAFYRGSRAVDAVRAASAAGWLVEPRPHLAFWRASVGQRLYLTAAVDTLTYARQLTDGDVGWVGGGRSRRCGTTCSRGSCRAATRRRRMRTAWTSSSA